MSGTAAVLSSSFTNPHVELGGGSSTIAIDTFLTEHAVAEGNTIKGINWSVAQAPEAAWAVAQDMSLPTTAVTQRWTGSGGIVSSNDGSLRAVSNTILYAAGFAITTIHVGDSHDVTISENHIAHLRQRSPLGGGGPGISISGADVATISGNQVSDVRECGKSQV